MAKNKGLENHYHCSECGKVLKEIGRIGFTESGGNGVIIIYQCSQHIFIWIERTNEIKKIY